MLSKIKEDLSLLREVLELWNGVFESGLVISYVGCILRLCIVVSSTLIKEFYLSAVALFVVYSLFLAGGFVISTGFADRVGKEV